MEERRQTQEELLQAWMEMSVYIRGNRILSDFSFNEIMICNLLLRQRRSGQPPLTATQLCQRTQLLKSQMNQIISGMEQRGLIARQRGTANRRVVHIHLREEALPTYQREHEKVLRIVDAVCTSIGYDNARTLAALMRQATAAVNTAISKEET